MKYKLINTWESGRGEKGLFGEDCYGQTPVIELSSKKLQEFIALARELGKYEYIRYSYVRARILALTAEKLNLEVVVIYHGRDSVNAKEDLLQIF